MKNNKIIIGITSMIVVSMLSGCAVDHKEKTLHTTAPVQESEHAGHSHSSEVPKNLKVAKNPVYPVGSQAILEANHLEGMKGAKATIVGAYDTIAYIVSYTPTTGGERVENHKWVIHEEIKEANNKPLKVGEKVTLEADHMKGMKGATAEINAAEKTTVYMVNYTPTTGGKEVKNHKWVIESELAPVK